MDGWAELTDPQRAAGAIARLRRRWWVALRLILGHQRCVRRLRKVSSTPTPCLPPGGMLLCAEYRGIVG